MTGMKNIWKSILILLVITIMVPIVLADVASLLDRDKGTGASQSEESIQERGGISNILNGNNDFMEFIRKNLSAAVLIWAIWRIISGKNPPWSYATPMFAGLGINYVLDYGLHFSLNSLTSYAVARIFNPILRIPSMIGSLINGGNIVNGLWSIIVGNVYTILGLMTINKLTGGKVKGKLKQAFSLLGGAVGSAFSKERREAWRQKRNERRDNKKSRKEGDAPDEDTQEETIKRPQKETYEEQAEAEIKEGIAIDKRTVFKELRETIKNPEIMQDIKRIEREYSLTKDKIELQRNLNVVTQKIIREKNIKEEHLNDTVDSLQGIYNSLFGVRIY